MPRSEGIQSMNLMLLADLDEWAKVAEIGTALFAAAAIWQIYQTKKTIRDAEYAAANGWMLDLDRLFLDRPELRAKFFSDIGFDPNDHATVALVEYVADSIDFFLKHRFGVGGSSDRLQESWREWVKGCFKGSRLLREYLRRNQGTHQEKESALRTLFDACKDLPNP